MLETSSAIAKSEGSETPWGLSWNALLPTLRPTDDEINLFSSIFTTIRDLLRASILRHVRLIPGSAFGKGTLLTGETTFDMYAIFPTFSPESYYEDHLNPLLQTLLNAKDANLTGLVDKGLAVTFIFDAITCRIFAAGELRAGPKELLLYGRAPRTRPNSANNSANNSASTLANNPTNTPRNRNSTNLEDVPDPVTPSFPPLEARTVHVETSCAVLRINLIAAQPPLYKDMVRVAKKWRAACPFMVADSAPGSYLLELLMLDAFHAAPATAPSPEMHAVIFRRFLALAAAHTMSGSDVLADEGMPSLFLSWSTYYNRAAIDYSMSMGLLKTAESRVDRSPLVVIDPAVPFVNVANTVSDWGELRKFARDSLSHFQNSDLLESVQTRLNSLTVGMSETLAQMQGKLDRLQSLENAPRRWSGNIQFREGHLSGGSWAMVTEVQLRTITWRVNARKARSEGMGYSSFVDVSLQMVGKAPGRTIDVDVNFRGTSHLVFDPANDHVLFARRSEVTRNRDYAIQITIVA